MQDFQSIYRANAARVLALGQRVLGQRQDAEDASQEIFLEIWRRSACFDPARGNEAGWVNTLARARLIDRSRLDTRRRTLLERFRRESSGAEQEGSSDPVRGSRDRARISAAIADLPAKQQQVLRLAYLEGLTHREIALSTGMPIGTVKTRIRMALERLCRDLGRSSGRPN